MMTIQHRMCDSWVIRLRFGRLTLWSMALLTLGTLMTSCQTLSETTPGTFNTIPPATTATETPEASAADDTPATITQIDAQPVWFRQQSQNDEVPAEVGMDLHIGDTIRTEDPALAELVFTNGLGFRIGGNAALTLQPGRNLELTSGEMITWVQPGKTIPVDIVTPVAIAGIRGTTVYVNIPDDPTAPVEFFSWEGTVSVRLPGQTEEIFLESGEQVFIAPGETDLERVRQSVRPIPMDDWMERRHGNLLLNGFETPLPTLAEIDTVHDAMMHLPQSDPALAEQSEHGQ
jgi:hypothetical protein